MANGESVDMCSIALFDPEGNYEFATNDMVTYPPGEYTFKIIGTVGSNSASETLVATFVDPCLTTTLTVIEPNPFPDLTYILRSD